MDDPSRSSQSQLEGTAAEVAERVRAVISAAEDAASALRHEAEEEAQARRRAAEQDAQRYIEAAQRQADAFLQDRLRRIGDLSDTLLERAESIVARLDRAEEVRRELQSLVDALGDAAARISAEVTDTGPGASPAAPPRAGPAPVDPHAPASHDPAPVGPPPGARGDSTPADQPMTATGAPTTTARMVDVGTREPSAEPGAGETPQPEASTPAVERPQDAERERPDGQIGEARTGIGGLSREQSQHSQEIAGEDSVLAARLVALQMAVAGASRGEVEDHLRGLYDLPDPADILNDIFGLGTDADKRVAWPNSADKTGQ